MSQEPFQAPGGVAVQFHPKVTFAPDKNSLAIEGQIVPPNELVHEMLAALLDEKNPPSTKLEFANVNDVLTLKVSFAHSKNIAEAGHASHKLRIEARDRRMTVADVKAEKEARAKAIAKAEAKSKSKNKKVKA